MTNACGSGVDKVTLGGCFRSQRALRFLGLALLCAGGAELGCSSDGNSGDANGGSGGASAGKGGSSSVGGTSGDAVVGTFMLALNPSVEATAPYTSIFGTVYGSPYPTDVIETVVASNAACSVYKFSRQSCTNPACTAAQTCVGPNVCEDKPSLVSIGDVSLTGVGPSALKLTAINNNYQYALDLPYPGFDDGGAVTLSATGSYFPAFSLTTKGTAPVELTATSYRISSGSALSVEWAPGSAGTAAKVAIMLNISKHGGSAGYMKCSTTDSGSFTVPADLLKALVDLGVAGFPQLLFTRSTRAEASVSTGKVAFEIDALASPKLDIDGYCSCFSSSDCGSCSDTTKTTCDTVKKLCNAP
ncbi:MAG: hypothetical protein QM756_09745 [Polyangiaceae bacterium]